MSEARGWQPRDLPAVVTAAALGAALRLGLVPHDNQQSADPRVGNIFFWICFGVAFALPLVFRHVPAALLGVALGAPQFGLAFFTAPHGDDDGLWVLWIPTMAVVTFGYAAASATTRVLDRYRRERAAERRRSSAQP